VEFDSSIGKSTNSLAAHRPLATRDEASIS
jgi:hypothetical protein